MFCGVAKLLSLLAFVALSQADYTIDDTNTTVLLYSVSPTTTVKWGPFSPTEPLGLKVGWANNSFMTVNDELCYDKTL